MKKEMTSTVFIIENGRVLLLLHRKLGVWMPPGGHVEEGELPHQCALREAREETGIEIQLRVEENIWVDYEHARSIPRPWMCLLEEVGQYGEKEAHQHIDMVFVGYPIGGRLCHNRDEAKAIRWFSAAEIASLSVESEVYPEVVEIALLLLKVPSHEVVIESIGSEPAHA